MEKEQLLAGFGEVEMELTEAQKALLKIGYPHFEDQTKTDLIEGNKRIIDEALIIRKDVTGEKGVVRLVDQNTKRQTAISDFQEGRAPEDMVVTHIGIRFATNQPDPIDALEWQESAEMAPWFPLLFSELYINHRGKRLLQMPAWDFFGYGTTQGHVKEAALKLEAPQILIRGKKLEIGLEFPDGVDQQVPATAGNKNFIEVTLYGSKLADRPN